MLMDMSSHAKLRAILGLVGILNVFDGLATLFFLNKEIATELNPLLNWGFSKSAISFILIKSFLVSTGIVLLWLAKESRYIPVIKVCWGLVSIYTCLLVYECVFFLSWLVGG